MSAVQLQFLEDQAPAPRPARWIGEPGPSGRYRAWSSPALPGIQIRHCGHPTALYPYYIDGQLQQLGTFAKLGQAKAAALTLHAARVLTSRHVAT